MPLPFALESVGGDGAGTGHLEPDQHAGGYRVTLAGAHDGHGGTGWRPALAADLEGDADEYEWSSHECKITFAPADHNRTTGLAAVLRIGPGSGAESRLRAGPGAPQSDPQSGPPLRAV